MSRSLLNWVALPELSPSPEFVAELEVTTEPINKFTTIHNLEFKTFDYNFEKDFNPLQKKRFTVGTCTGILGHDSRHYYVLSIENSKSGNGHFEDVMEHLEGMSKEDGRDIVFANLYNASFYAHLVRLRGYKPVNQNTVVKIM